MKHLKLLCAAFAVLLCVGCGSGSPDVTDTHHISSDTEANVTETENTTETADTTADISADTETFDTDADTDEPEEKLPSVLDFLRIAASPVGSTMYVWGGGWNEADTGAGQDAVTLGISERWAKFASDKDASYDYKDYRYQIRDGLDCSGYVGWAVYNVLETENGRDGNVTPSTEMASSLAARGLGAYIPADEMTEWQAGDVMSMKGHCWISVGQCADGSVLLLHSSPPGVIFCGPRLSAGGESDAVRRAREIMSERYPDWYARFSRCDADFSYLEKSSAMRWEVLSDGEGLRGMTAEEVVGKMFAIDQPR